MTNMTPEETNKAIAVSLGVNDKVGLIKRGYWWRPNSKGYTSIESEAGRYTREEAARIADSEVTIREFSVPKYTECLNLCAEFERRLTSHQKIRYVRHLREIIQKASAHSGDPSEFFMITATPLQRCQAYLRTINAETR